MPVYGQIHRRNYTGQRSQGILDESVVYSDRRVAGRVDRKVRRDRTRKGNRRWVKCEDGESSRSLLQVWLFPSSLHVVTIVETYAGSEVWNGALKSRSHTNRVVHTLYHTLSAFPFHPVPVPDIDGLKQHDDSLGILETMPRFQGPLLTWPSSRPLSVCTACNFSCVSSLLKWF